MSVDLYFTAGSPPCRLVLLVAAALDLQLNLHSVNLQAGEQFHPEFLKLNPQHTVPTMVDDDFVLWESRAISRYLVRTYSDGSPLYPAEPRAQALIDQRLDFDIGTLYPRFSKYFYPQIFGGKLDPDALKSLQESLLFLDTFLDRKYAAGDDLTLADLALVATVSTIEAADVDLKPYANVVRWLQLVKETAPGYKEANERGIQEFKQLISKLKAKTEL